jgi:hypothetical protein
MYVFSIRYLDLILGEGRRRPPDVLLEKDFMNAAAPSRSYRPGIHNNVIGKNSRHQPPFFRRKTVAILG